MPTLQEYYNTGNDSSSNVQGTQWYSEAFTPLISHKFIKVKLLLRRAGSPGTVTVGLRTADGNYKPTGTDLISNTFNGNTVTTDSAGEWVEITFGSGYDVVAGTSYAIVVSAPSGDSSNNLEWAQDSTSPTYTRGWVAASSDSGVTWSAQNGFCNMFEEWSTTNNLVSASVSLGLAPTVNRAITTARSASASMSLVAGVSTELNIAEMLCIASRDNGSIRTVDKLGASWVDCAKDAGGGLPSAYFAQYLNRLCAINSQNMGFSYSAVNDIVSNWTEKSGFPNLPQQFTGLFVGRDAGDDPILYFLTPTGMFYLDVFSNFVFGPTELQWEYDSTSGKKGIYWKGSHYVAVGKGIFQITGGVVTPVGPDMDDGLPEDMQGTIADMIGVGFWLVIAIDGGSLNKSSILKRYISGKHWHTVYLGSVNTPIRSLFWDSGTLYFGEGTNVKSLPMSNKTDNVVKLSTHTYGTSGDLIYPYFHSEFEAMPKIAHKVRAVTQGCNSNEKITIHYRTDETTSWTELGSFTSSPRPTALSFPASGDSIGVSFERIQFKASFARGSTTTNSPKLESLTLEYRVVPPVLWGWDFRVQAVSEGDRKGKDVIDALKTAIETGTLLSFYPDGDKSSTQYFVEVSGMPGNESGTEFGQEGIYQVSVNEVIE